MIGLRAGEIFTSLRPRRSKTVRSPSETTGQMSDYGDHELGQDGKVKGIPISSDLHPPGQHGWRSETPSDEPDIHVGKTRRQRGHSGRASDDVCPATAFEELKAIQEAEPRKGRSRGHSMDDARTRKTSTQELVSSIKDTFKLRPSLNLVRSAVNTGIQRFSHESSLSRQGSFKVTGHRPDPPIPTICVLDTSSTDDQPLTHQPAPIVKPSQLSPSYPSDSIVPRLAIHNRNEGVSVANAPLAPELRLELVSRVKELDLTNKARVWVYIYLDLAAERGSEMEKLIDDDLSQCFPDMRLTLKAGPHCKIVKPPSTLSPRNLFLGSSSPLSPCNISTESRPFDKVQVEVDKMPPERGSTEEVDTDSIDGKDTLKWAFDDMDRFLGETTHPILEVTINTTVPWGQPITIKECCTIQRPNPASIWSRIPRSLGLEFSDDEHIVHGRTLLQTCAEDHEPGPVERLEALKWLDKMYMFYALLDHADTDFRMLPGGRERWVDSMKPNPARLRALAEMVNVRSDDFIY